MREFAGKTLGGGLGVEALKNHQISGPGSQNELAILAERIHNMARVADGITSRMGALANRALGEAPEQQCGEVTNGQYPRNYACGGAVGELHNLLSSLDTQFIHQLRSLDRFETLA